MDTDKLSDQLIIDEDKRKHMYKDTVGKWTVGVGRNLSDRDFSDDEIMLMLQNDIDMVCDQLDNVLPWWKQMSDARMRALANMTFNMGITKILTFKNSLTLLRTGKYNAAADAFLKSKWATQVGERADRIAELIRNG